MSWLVISVAATLALAEPASRPADEAKAPPRTRLETPDRAWRLEILPTKYSPRVRGTCVARLELRRPSESREEERRPRDRMGRRDKRPRGWTRCLVNDRSPDRAMLTPDGMYVVTIDEWPADSRRHPLVIYGPEGELVRHFRLEDLIDARAAAEAREADAPVRWGRSAKFAFDRDHRYLIVRPADDEALLIELATGNLLRRDDSAVARAPQLKTMLDEAVAAGDELFPSIEPLPLADPGEKADFLGWLNDLFRGSDEDNSAPLIEAAAEQLSDFPGTAEPLAQAAKAWNAETSQTVAPWLDANAAAIDLFRQAARKSAYRYDMQSEDGSMMGATLPTLSSIRTLTRALLADASRALAEGRDDAAADDYRDALDVARQLLQRPTLIEYLTGLATSGAAYENLLRLPLRTSNDTTDYAALRERFSASELDIPSVAPLIELERLMFHDTVQRLYEPDQADGRPVPDLESIDKLAGQIGCDQAELRAALQNTAFDDILTSADQHYDRWTEALRHDFPSARERFDELNRQVEDEPNLLVRKILPVFGRVSQLQATGQARRRAALLTLALHEHRARTGSLPATLAELSVKGLDARTLVDPFTEQPFRYERSGASFRLWTLGADGVDDGGKLVPLSQPGGDSVLFPPP